MEVLIITNNSLVRDRLGERCAVAYGEISYLEVLLRAQALVRQGHELLSHPLSGSLKPGETPYKSVVLSLRPGEPQPAALRLVERGIDACGKFADRTGEWNERQRGDFRLVDYSLIAEGLSPDLLAGEAVMGKYERMCGN